MPRDYLNILPIARSEATATVQRGVPGEVAVAVLSVALHEPNLTWAESFCLPLAKHPNPHIRGNALLSFGHLARIHGRLTNASIARIVTDGLRDEDTYVRGQARAAADDLNHFLHWQVVDLSNYEVFHVVAEDRGWIYDNGAEYEGEYRSEYRWGDLSLLRHRNADVIVLQGSCEERRIVWRGPVQCREDFDILRDAINDNKLAIATEKRRIAETEQTDAVDPE